MHPPESNANFTCSDNVLVTIFFFFLETMVLWMSLKIVQQLYLSFPLLNYGKIEFRPIKSRNDVTKTFFGQVVFTVSIWCRFKRSRKICLCHFFCTMGGGQKDPCRMTGYKLCWLTKSSELKWNCNKGRIEKSHKISMLE